jgi:hypothetical protein
MPRTHDSRDIIIIIIIIHKDLAQFDPFQLH